MAFAPRPWGSSGFRNQRRLPPRDSRTEQHSSTVVAGGVTRFMTMREGSERRDRERERERKEERERERERSFFPAFNKRVCLVLCNRGPCQSWARQSWGPSTVIRRGFAQSRVDDTPAGPFSISHRAGTILGGRTSKQRPNDGWETHATGQVLTNLNQT